MNRLSPFQRHQIAEDIALQWPSVAACCGVEPSGITAYLHAGATPLDCSVKLVDTLYNRAFGVGSFTHALRSCGLERQAKRVEQMLGSAAAPASMPQLLVTVAEHLTPDNKEQVLMQIGVPPGTASTVAHKGSADFWAKIAQHVSIDTPSQLAALFTGMPGIQRLILPSSADVPVERASAAGGTFASRLANAANAEHLEEQRKAVDNMLGTMIERQHPDWMLVASILNKAWVENGTRETKCGWELLLALLGTRKPALAQTLAAMRVHYRNANQPNVALAIVSELIKAGVYGGKDWNEFVFDDLAAVNSASMAREVADKVGTAIADRAANADVSARQMVDADNSFNMLRFITENKSWLKKDVDPERACQLLSEEGGANTLAELAELNEQDVGECGFHKRGAKLLLAAVAAQLEPHAPANE